MARGIAFTARIDRRVYRGQELFNAAIFMEGFARPVKRVPQYKCLTAVQCEVLDWATAMGKRENLKWQYNL